MITKKTKVLFRERLLEIISRNISGDEVPVLLSGGVDSTLVAFSIHELGKKVVGISYELDGIVNPDCSKAENTCIKMGWDFEKVVIPLQDPKIDFLELIRKHGCKKKTELEILFPMIGMVYRLSQLGFDQVYSGFEGWIPDTRSYELMMKENPQKFWNHVINSETDLMSSGTHKCLDYSESVGVKIETPLDSKELMQIYSELSYEDCHKPVWKYLFKCLYEEHFRKCDLWDDPRSPNLQVGGKVEDYFVPILSDPGLNYKEYNRGNPKRRLSHLARLWGTNPDPTVRRFESYSLRDVEESSSRNLFQVVSTFSGGGGSSTGYKLAGGKVLFTNEFIKTAVDTYRSNYPDTPVSDLDIRKITSKRKKGIREWFRSYGVEPGEYDILDGSPPCCSFSVSKRPGKGKEVIDQKVVPYSETTQVRPGTLIHDFVSLVCATDPKVFIVENVPSIRTSDVFHEAMNRLRGHGYIVGSKPLVASDFGVPQKRTRLFIIGVRSDISKRVGLSHEKDILELYPTGSSIEVTVRDALQGLEIDPRERNLLLSKCRKSVEYEMIRFIPTGLDRPHKVSYIRDSWNTNFNLVRSSWSKPSPTLTQLGQQIGRGGVHHPDENRLFTTQELKRLMSLPDDFHLTGTFNQRAERICRMVPPLLMKSVVQSVYEKVLM